MTGFQLTDEQLAIVNYPLDQPLRVAAGAGTGKTTTIALRLAMAIESGEIEPEQALGLTFTNKATEELADHLHRLLPDQTTAGRYIQVTTYHGFAWTVLTEFGAYVGIERDSRIIGPGYVRQLILETIIEAQDVEHLDLTALGARTNNVSSLAAQLANTLVTTDALRKAAPDKLDDVWQARLELTQLVSDYNRRKDDLALVDYADLITTAQTIVTDHPEVARRIRQRYRIVLLDEYQDTDAGQRKLLQAIFGDGFPITAVGDGDQTIYEWRGASPANFDAFPHHFPDPDGDEARTLPLTLNRRSGSLILDLGNALRTEIHGRSPNDPLRPAADAGEGALRLAYHNDARAEALTIAEEMRRLHDEDDVAWSAMTVLFRTNGRITVVRAALEQLEIPHEVASLGGLLSVPDVADLHAWLTLLSDPEATASLTRIVLGPWFRLGIGDLAPLAAWARSRKSLDDDAHLAWPLLEAVDRLDQVDELTKEAAKRLTRFRVEYSELLVVTQTHSLVELCRRILDRTDAWIEIDARQPAAALTARLNLFRFLDVAQEWSPLEGRPSLEAFLGYLATLEEESTSDELDTASAGNSDAVSLLTVHRAKGLEWPVVFLPGLTEPGFPTRPRKFDYPHAAATSVPYDLRVDSAYLPTLTGNTKDDKDLLRERHRIQELRTAYVAVTRAKDRLYLSGSYHWGQTTPQPPSIIFRLARDLSGAVVDVDQPPGDVPETTVLEAAVPAPDPVFGDGWQEAMRRTARSPDTIDELRSSAGISADAYDAEMEQFSLQLEGLPEPPEPAGQDDPTSVSVTSLVTMAQCPRRYFWSEVDRLPRRPSAAMRHGTEVHRRIELFHRGQMPLEDLDAVSYDTTPGEHTGTDPTGDAFENFTKSGFASRSPVFIETQIDIALPSGRVRGRIDAVYPMENGWEIVDYKSGRPHADTSRQIQLDTYAIAARDGVLGTPPEHLKLSFVFLGGSEAAVESVEVDNAYLDSARKRLERLLSAIDVGDTDRAAFPTDTGSHCQRCDFLPHCRAGTAFIAEDT